MFARWFWYLIVIMFILSFTPGTPAQQEEDRCPALVESALEIVGDACSGLRRNQICYGHGNVTALDFERAELADFAATGDKMDLLQVFSLATAPMDIDRNVWGVAVLTVLANLPDTIPGQGVTFVIYGDTELVSEVPPDAEGGPPPALTARATGGVNIRSGPGTHYAVAGSLAGGEQVTVTGRNDAGDWLRIAADDTEAWVFASLLDVDGDLETLAVLAAGEPGRSVYSAPMQAFRMTTGVGEPACEEAPRDGILVQAPAETTVFFRINGIEVEIGSTALMQMKDQTLGVNTLDGSVSVTSAGQTETAQPGQRVDVVAGSAPAAPVSYSAQDISSAPVNLLPEPVIIPPPAGNLVSLVGCDASGGQASVPAGQPLVMQSGWADATRDLVYAYVSIAIYNLTYDRQPVELWGTTEEPREDRYLMRWWWVIPDPQPGVHQVTSSRTLPYEWNDAFSGTESAGTTTFNCTITVQ